MISLSDAAFLEPQKNILAVEEQARLCLDKCTQKLGLKQLPLPVPVEQFIEGPLGIDFGIEDLSRFSDGSSDVLGACFIEQRQILVSETLLDNDGRYRFTCAHELGHMILHADRQAPMFRDTQVATWPEQQNIEREADRFAAALLMPVHELIRTLIQTLQSKRLELKHAITELMLDTAQSLYLWKKIILPAITRRFDVSLQAAIYRFSDLQMTDAKPFLLDEIKPALFKKLPQQSPVHQIYIENGQLIQPVVT